MSDLVVRYATAPTLSINYPTCGACLADVDSDGDGWVCPDCGTSWSYKDGDGDTGTLYADWSGGDVSDLPVTSHESGWIVAISRRGAR